MTTTDLQQERRKLGPVQQIQIEASTLAQAHGQLGRRLGPVICRVARRRLKATPTAEFEQHLAAVRDCRRRLEARALSKLTKLILR